MSIEMRKLSPEDEQMRQSFESRNNGSEDTKIQTSENQIERTLLQLPFQKEDERKKSIDIIKHTMSSMDPSSQEKIYNILFKELDEGEKDELIKFFLEKMIRGN